MRPPFNLFFLLVLLISAFLLVKEFDRPVQDLAYWSNVSDSLVESGQRGLGGGIEYSIAPDFCSNIIPLFSGDNPKPTCAQLKAAIRRAFDRWAEGHPVIRFIEVTDKIAAQLNYLGQTLGAEIDFLALSPSQYPKLQDFSAVTDRWFLDANPRGTNHQYRPGLTYANVDIVFSTSSCFFFNLNGGEQRCPYFETVALHEIGHALGLQHPGEYPEDFWVINDDSLYQVEVEIENTMCHSTTTCVEVNGCKFPPPEQAKRFDQNTVMTGGLLRTPIFELSKSDIAIRDFLYPICD